MSIKSNVNFDKISMYILFLEFMNFWQELVVLNSSLHFLHEISYCCEEQQQAKKKQQLRSHVSILMALRHGLFIWDNKVMISYVCIKLIESLY